MNKGEMYRYLSMKISRAKLDEIKKYIADLEQKYEFYYGLCIKYEEELNKENKDERKDS